MKYFFLISCSLIVAAPAWAQDAGSDADGNWDGGCCQLAAQRIPDVLVTVVATGSHERVEDTGQSISVIGAGEIKAVQGPDLTRVLERLPGVTWARSGPLGSQTSLFVRGANSQQLLVTLDGVRMADTAAPSGGTDLGTILPANLAKIELLRGSNSVAWGSDAIGGVLALTSAELDGAQGSLEYGANETVSATAMLGKQGDSHGVTASGGYVSSDGISAYDLGTEADGFRQWYGTIRAHADLASGLGVNAVARYADSRVEFDGYPPPTYSTFADTPEYQTTRQASGRIGLDYAANGFALRGGLALSDTRRDYFDPTFGSAPNYTTSGRSWRADLIGKADLVDNVTLDFGAGSEWTRFSTLFDAERDARLSSGHALLGYHRDRIDLSAGVRVDDHDRFGTHWTFGANGAFEMASNLRLRASYGEGFKAPTLYQLYGFGGNAALKPEESTAFEAAVELGSRARGTLLAVTLFRRDATNLIDYVWPSGYFNTGRTRAEGFELEGMARVSETVQVRAAYSYTKATNRLTGADLARRPRHALSAGIDWTTPLSGLTLGADLRMVSDSFDDAGNITRLDGYGLLTLRAAVPLGEHLELYGRVENVTDSRYTTVASYGTYGSSAYAGVRVKW